MAGMMRDGLQTDRGLQPLAFEMASAVDLSGRGFKLQFVDLESCERFDYLIRKDGVEAEFECKTVSYDLGRQVHRRVFERLGKQVFERGVSEFLTTSGPNIRIDLTLEARLPSGEKPLARVVDMVASALRGNAATEPGLGRARASEWDIPGRPDDLRQSDLKGTFDRGDDDHTLIAIGPRRAFALVASSEKPARLLQGVFRELRRVAREQLSGTRPGVIAVQIEDIRESDWVQLSHGSAIEAMTAAYFVTGRREHIHSVLYSSEQLLHKAPGRAWLSGTRLVYRNPANAEAANPVLDLTL